MPVFFALYYLVPYGAKNTVLFIGSIVFYGWGEPKYLLLIFASILVNYLSGLIIERSQRAGNIAAKRTVFVLTLCFDIEMLLFFKYADFFVTNLNALSGRELVSLPGVTLPLGISFYTFQIMSYVIDLYRERVRAEHSLLNLGTYLVMFPQLIAGPIVVYSQVNRELKERRITLSKVGDGLRVFILGLASKVLVANNVGQLWEELSELGYENISTPLAWLGAVAFTLQIFFDFNGYSLMAIGLGKLLGFEFPKNFDLPYISASISEFWRTWHMTLGAWFREYLYIPLGGNRKGRVRTYVNLFIVWFITGFWHGAGWNFVLWGLYFFVLIALERLFFGDFLKRHRIFSHVYTLFFVTVSWVIFSITDFSGLGTYFSRMFVFHAGEDIWYYLGNYGIILLLGIVLSTPLGRKLYRRVETKPAGQILMMGLLVLCVAYLADASFNPFLYFRF